MDRRAFIKLAGGGVVFAALPSFNGCSTQIPAEATAAWKHPSNDLEVRKWILSYAIFAPHSHNLQSWLVDLRKPSEITLYCDLTRLLPETDPYSRQIMMSHGTFIELLDMAARERGLKTDVELFPEGEFDFQKLDNRPVAVIQLTEDQNIQRDPLFA